MIESRAQKMSDFINDYVVKHNRGPSGEEIQEFYNQLAAEDREKKEKIEQHKSENDEKLRKFILAEREKLEKTVAKAAFLPGTEFTVKCRVTEEGDLVTTGHDCSSPGIRGSWNVTASGEITKEPVRNSRPYIRKVESAEAA